MHVDGFRFDLAATLARELHEVDRLSAFFDLIQQDPIVSQVKLIAEPWDVGEGGYQVGNFPALWSEWNGKYRDSVRDYWRGADQTLGEFANRLQRQPRSLCAERPPPVRQRQLRLRARRLHPARPGLLQRASTTRPTARTTATARATTDRGITASRAPTDDPAVIELRARQQRNFLATLLLSQGVPMLLAGDELGRTQRGNNNAYCQDNELSWIDWAQRRPRADAVSPARCSPFDARILCSAAGAGSRAARCPASDARDIAWFTPAGVEMSEEDWSVGFAKSLMLFLNGQAIPNRGPRGEAVSTTRFLLCFNAHYEPLPFTLPPCDIRRTLASRDRYRRSGPCAAMRRTLDPGARSPSPTRSMVVMQLRRNSPLAGPSLRAATSRGQRAALAFRLLWHRRRHRGVRRRMPQHRFRFRPLSLDGGRLQPAPRRCAPPASGRPTSRCCIRTSHRRGAFSASRRKPRCASVADGTDARVASVADLAVGHWRARDAGMWAVLAAGPILATLPASGPARRNLAQRSRAAGHPRVAAQSLRRTAQRRWPAAVRALRRHAMGRPGARRSCGRRAPSMWRAAADTAAEPASSDLRPNVRAYSSSQMAIGPLSNLLSVSCGRAAPLAHP